MRNSAKFVIITLSIMCYLVSCSNHITKGVILQQSVMNAHVVPPPIKVAVAPVHDTVRLIQPTHDEANIQHTITTLSANPGTNKDSLNVEWQKVALRAINYSHSYHLERDSALIVVKSIRDTVNAIKSSNRSAKTEHLQLSATFGMFDYIIGACLVICTLAAIKTLLPAHWFKKHYTV